MENELRKLETNQKTREFNNGSAVERLESLLAKEEGLRRKIEISARETKSLLDAERARNHDLVEEARTKTIQLETETNSRKRIQKQLTESGDAIQPLIYPLEFIKSNTVGGIIIYGKWVLGE